MGQRLVLNIRKDGEILANAYYHWSAYTQSTLDVIRLAIEFYKRNKLSADKAITEPHKLAVLMLENTGAGLIRRDIQKCQDEWFDFGDPEYTVCTDRNNGLIAITEENISGNLCWAEGEASIYLDSETVENGVINFYEAEEIDYFVENGDLDRDEYNFAPIINNIDITSFSFDNIDCAIDICNADAWRDGMGNYYSCIG